MRLHSHKPEIGKTQEIDFFNSLAVGNDSISTGFHKIRMVSITAEACTIHPPYSTSIVG